MSQPADTRVIFKDGFAKAKDWIILASEIVALENEEGDYTRAYTFKAGNWRHFDLEGIAVRSVHGAPTPARGTYFLGRSGEVVLVSPDGRTTELIPDAGTGPEKLGYVNRMRVIDGALYVCGSSGQVYRRDNSGWVHLDQGLADHVNSQTRPNLYGIDGTSKEEIYVVGERGMISRYDGLGWTTFQPFTTEFLMAVHCVSRDDVYVCGRNGAFFYGRWDKWEDFSLRRKPPHFWSLEVYRSVVYVASSNGLYALEGDKLFPVETGLLPKPDAYRLHATDGVLWSFGNHHICFFDGENWTYVKHPDNP
jgi:hypothetical protein